MTDREFLGDQWRVVASALDINCVAPFYLPSENGPPYEFAALLPQFGGERGMLIDIEHVPKTFSVAVDAEYGCSSMFAETHHLPLDPANYIECLVDWGWFAKDRAPPEWYSCAL